MTRVHVYNTESEFRSNYEIAQDVVTYGDDFGKKPKEGDIILVSAPCQDDGPSRFVVRNGKVV